jgi:hypothetical protein
LAQPFFLHLTTWQENLSSCTLKIFQELPFSLDGSLRNI